MSAFWHKELEVFEMIMLKNRVFTVAVAAVMAGSSVGSLGKEEVYHEMD